jgi:hypothetical protein
MRKILISIAALTIVAFSGISMSFAQDDGPPNFVPVEMQACNYADGKDAGDFEDAMDDMVKWMEDNDGAPYAAWTLSKFYTDPSREFDFLYMGAWPNGSTMGQDQAHYFATAKDEMAAFSDAADCGGSSALYASLEVKAPPESDGQGDGFILTMSDCKVAEGRKTADAIGAVRAYGEYRDANGSPGGTYLFFPAFGVAADVADAEFDFKLLNSYASVEAFGNNYQWIVENAAYLKSGELMDGLLECDTPRAYAGDTVVNTIATQ